MTEIEELQKMVKEFCVTRDWDQFHNPKDLAIGISTEANELLDLFRFKTDEQMNEMMNNLEKREAISEELSDVFYFLLRFSQLYGFDMKKGLEKKMKKNNERYPVDKTKGKNMKYTEI